MKAHDREKLRGGVGKRARTDTNLYFVDSGRDLALFFLSLDERISKQLFYFFLFSVFVDFSFLFCLSISQILEDRLSGFKYII